MAKSQEPIIYMSEYQFAALYCAELERKGTIDRVRDYLDAHNETRISHIHDLIKVAWAHPTAPAPAKEAE